jgi:histidyl-tRNA synthetase
VDSIDADVEIISLAYDIMKEFGAKTDDFEIRVNSRKSLHELFVKMGLDEEKEITFRRLLDKKNKIEDFDKQAEEILGKPFKAEMAMSEEILKVIEKLKSRGVSNIVFDSSVVRGFDYYTGTVFEVYDKSPENSRSLFGGGRYDDLVGIFDVEKVSGVGFGMGDVTIADFLETHNLKPVYKPATQLYICPYDSSFIENANNLANYLRSQNINVAVDFTDRPVGKKVKTADKENIPFVVVVGQEEVESGKFKVKSLKDSKETIFEKDEFGNFLKGD